MDLPGFWSYLCKALFFVAKIFKVDVFENFLRLWKLLLRDFHFILGVSILSEKFDLLCITFFSFKMKSCSALLHEAKKFQNERFCSCCFSESFLTPSSKKLILAFFSEKK